MKKVIQKSKKTSLAFHPENTKYSRSTIKSNAIKYDSIINSRKHRTVKELYKQEIRREGRILPSTLEKPNFKVSKKSYLSGSFERSLFSHFELSLMVNSKMF